MISISLIRVACDAERLEVAQVVAAAFRARQDVVDMKRCVFFMGSAKLTAVLGPLEHLVPYGAGHIPIRNAAMPPNAITALVDVIGKALLAEINEGAGFLCG